LTGDVAWAHTALRTDAVGGIEETAGYLTSGVFLSVHRSLTAQDGRAVLVCPTVHSGGLMNYRREVNLGRQLARRGFVAVRPQYYGSANSLGDDSELTLDTMVRDARAAVELVGAECSTDLCCIVGVRLGALVAAARHEWRDLPLALWEPVVKGSDYFREAFRAELMRRMRQKGDDDRPTRSDLEERMRTEGSVEVVGELIHRSFHESVHDRSLLPIPGGDGREVLLVGFGGSGGRARLKEELVAAGSRVVQASSEVNETWWFQDEGTDPEVDAATASTVSWILDRTGAGTRGELGG
jgi:alpha/beta superfamily hydrolase